MVGFLHVCLFWRCFLKMFFRLEREEGAASTSLMNILTLRYFTSSLTSFFHPIIPLSLSVSPSMQIRVSADHAGPPLPSGVPLPPPAAPGAHLPDHLAQHKPRPLAAPSCCRLPQRRWPAAATMPGRTSLRIADIHTAWPMIIIMSFSERHQWHSSLQNLFDWN